MTEITTETQRHGELMKLRKKKLDKEFKNSATEGPEIIEIKKIKPFVLKIKYSVNSVARKSFCSVSLCLCGLIKGLHADG